MRSVPNPMTRGAAKRIFNSIYFTEIWNLKEGFIYCIKDERENTARVRSKHEFFSRY